jgi:hypothetical protein
MIRKISSPARVQQKLEMEFDFWNWNLTFGNWNSSFGFGIWNLEFGIEGASRSLLVL